MKNVIVASFKEEAKAIDALHKLNELELVGDISIYEQIMIRKKANGEIETLKRDDSEGWRTFTGAAIGSMLGLLGGPVGFVIGLYTGTAIGAIAELDHFDFAEDFMAKIEKKIPVGNTSIIAEIEEESKAFVDTELKPFGAVITRSSVEYDYDNYVNEQLDAIEDDIAEDRAALKKAAGNEKKKIQKKIAELKEKRKAIIAEFVAKRKKAEKNIKDKTTASVAKVKEDLIAAGSNITREVKKEKIDRIKRKIGRHEDALNALNMQLDELKS